MHVGLGPLRRPLVLGAVEGRGAEPVLPGEVEGVLDPGAALLGRVDEHQPAERPEGLSAERRLGLLIDDQDALAGVGQFARGGQSRQTSADDDRRLPSIPCP